MMKIRRTMLFLLMFVLVFVAACSNSGTNSSSDDNKNDKTSEEPTALNTDEGTAGSAAKEEYVIKILGRANQSNIKKSDETPIGKIIKDKFNIVLEYIPFTGDYRDKLNMMLAAGDYPELLRVERQDLVQKYIQAGAAIPLDDFLKDSPNFKKRYEEVIPYWRVPAEDGKLYKWEFGVLQDINNVCECHDMAVRTDVLEEQGWPELVSTADYIEFLKKGLKDHPETNGKKTLGMVVPFAESWGTAGLAPIMYEKGGRYIAIGNEGVIFNVLDQKYEHMLTNEYTKESYKFFNDLYREGILDRESFTDTYDKVMEKLNSGQALSVYYAWWSIGAANKNFIEAGHPEMQYIRTPIRTVTQVERNEKRQLRLELTRPFDSVIITKNAKEPKRIFELIEWAASEEGQLLLQSGIEGVHYKVVDGKRVSTDEFIEGTKDANYAEKQGFGMFSLLGSVQNSAEDGQPYNLLNDVKLGDKINHTDRMRETYEKLGWEHSLDYWYKTGVAAPAGLAAAIIVDPSSELGMVHQQMVQLRVKNTANLIQAKSDEDFEKIWNNLIGQYNKLDPQRVVDKYNELYQEQLKRVEELK